ncbi:MAG: hypothetical protein HC790_12590 [Acaryochloridaceae cyanobacterium CSU_3_4]|nr:hypothetical protein [Acaryochloridaceae cyanobacterium CSU_3_4]
MLEGNTIWKDMRSLTPIAYKQSTSSPSHTEGIKPSIHQSADTTLMQATTWIKTADNKILLVGKAPVERFSGNWLSYSNCQRK